METFALLILILGASVIALLIGLPIILMQKSSVKKNWQQLAEELDLQYEPRQFNQFSAGGAVFGAVSGSRAFAQTQPHLLGQYQGRAVAMGVLFADMIGDQPVNREKLSPAIDPSDRNASKVSTLRVAAQTQIPPHYHLACSRGGALITLARKAKIPKVKTGDRPLDRRFRLRSRPEALAQRFLTTPEVRQALMDWQPKKPWSEFGRRAYGFEVRNGYVRYEEERPSNPFSALGASEALEMVVGLAAALDAIALNLDVADSST